MGEPAGKPRIPRARNDYMLIAMTESDMELDRMDSKEQAQSKKEGKATNTIHGYERITLVRNSVLDLDHDRWQPTH